MKIKGVNLGNWLVLEKWMNPALFEGTDAEDETWLARRLSSEEFAARLKEHRETYITEKDFEKIAGYGLNLVRIPVPYFICLHGRTFRYRGVKRTYQSSRLSYRSLHR